VTHLPQIASMADNHYFIEKHSGDNDTVTTVRLLDKNGQIEEISRLSGAKDISKQASENAKQMKEWSNRYKKTIGS
jgi:DNA repair protein RecN (Recombination protein N)